MKHFNNIRLRSYLEYIIIGTLAFFIGGEILYSIIYEMNTAYDLNAKYAYICGIVLSGVVVLTGIIIFIIAANLNKAIFKNLTDDERKLFYKEINDDSTLNFGKFLVIMPHFVLAYSNSFLKKVRIIKMDDLVACFGKEIYGTGNELESYQLLIFDCSFKKIQCVVKGEQAQYMDEGYQTLLRLSPWVFSDNYDEFINSYTRRSKEKAYLKEIELRRQKTVTDHTLPGIDVTAADIINKFNEKQKMMESIPSQVQELEILDTESEVSDQADQIE